MALDSLDGFQALEPNQTVETKFAASLYKCVLLSLFIQTMHHYVQPEDRKPASNMDPYVVTSIPPLALDLTLADTNKELATHIGEVVINKCFAIYLASKLEDKTEICKVSGLLRYLDDLLPSNYRPAIPPEKAFPTATISSRRSSTPRISDGMLELCQSWMCFRALEILIGMVMITEIDVSFDPHVTVLSVAHCVFMLFHYVYFGFLETLVAFA